MKWGGGEVEEESWVGTWDNLALLGSVKVADSHKHPELSGHMIWIGCYIPR